MKTKEEDLKKRGFLKEGVEVAFQNISFKEKIVLLKSTIATERTLGARLLKTDKRVITVTYLIETLILEKKLYTKIAICNSLVDLDELAIKPLINYLGKIGNNQHKKIPDKEFKKDSYPLPRDIASRTLIRIGKKAVPYLIETLKTVDKRVLSELIDTIGYINFYNQIDNLFLILKTLFNKHNNDLLISWKIIRALSGVKESKEFLKEQYLLTKNSHLKIEIKRSLRLLNK